MSAIGNLILTPAQQAFMISVGLYAELGCNPKLPYLGLAFEDLATIQRKINKVPVNRQGTAILRKVNVLHARVACGFLATGTRRPRLLDLFCSAGGCSVGYHRAGYDVVGVDIRPQPRYPFEFHQGDALTYPLEGFDAIHASPPCQAYAQAALSQRNAGKVYPDLIVPVRERLEKSGLPFVIENVIGAPLQNVIMLCGSMFGLRVWRHRLFETTLKHWPLLHPCNHTGLGICVVGHGTPSWIRQKNGGKCVGIAEMRAAMGIDWMNRDELSQAIPPAYTEFIGRLLLDSNDCG